MMGLLGTAVQIPYPDLGAFGLYFGAEDKTAGTAYTTSDGSGYAHVDYAQVDGTALSNAGALVAPSTRIRNLFPLTGIVSVSIRRGRTRPDQYDDVGEMTVVVNNQGSSALAGQSDPDNNAGRYQRIIANTQTPLAISNITGNGTTVTVTVPSTSTLTIGQAVAITGTTYYNCMAYVAGTTATQFTFASERTGTEIAYTFSSATPYKNTPTVYSSWLMPGMFGRWSYQPTAGTIVHMFTGVLESVVPTDDIWSTSTYTFVDRMAIIGRTKINSTTIGMNGDTGAQRLNLILDNGGLPNVINTNGSATIVYEQANTSYTGTYRDIKGFAKTLARQVTGDSALDSIKTIIDGEAGRVFANSDGIICCYDRPALQTRASAIAATFSDTAAIPGYGYDEIHINQAQDYIYNKAIITYGTTITTTGSNDASIATYGERTVEKTVVLTDGAAQQAAALFYAFNWSQPKKTPVSISTQTTGLSSADKAVIATIDLGDSVRVVRQQPGGRQFDGTAVVEGIEVDLTPETQRFTFYLSAMDQAVL